MKLSTRLSGAVLATLCLLVACGGDSGSRRFVSIGTAPTGGAFFVVGSALSEVLDQAQDNWEVNAESTKGSQENIRRLDSGELDFGLANSAITYFAVRGESGWEKAYPMRSVMTLAPNVALFVTSANSGILRIADLRGKRVVVGPAGAGFEYFLKPLLQAHGMSYDDFTPLNNSQAGAVDLLADGAAAAAFLGGAVPTSSITQASSSQDIRFIPYGEAERQELVQRYPFFHNATIPAQTYRGQDQEYKGLDVGSMHLITRADLDEEMVYQVTKILYENREQVVARHAAGRSIRAENVVRNLGTEFHPGAVRYYKEIGIWTGE